MSTRQSLPAPPLPAHVGEADCAAANELFNALFGFDYRRGSSKHDDRDWEVIVSALAIARQRGEAMTSVISTNMRRAAAIYGECTIDLSRLIPPDARAAEVRPIPPGGRTRYG